MYKQYSKIIQIDKITLNQSILFGVIFGVVGICMLLINFNNMKNYIEKSRIFVETQAIVVDYRYSDESSNKAVIVEYEVNGRTYKIASFYASNIVKNIGDIVKIKYNPYEPEDAIFKYDFSIIILIIMGFVFTFTGITIIIFGIKNNKAKEIQ